MYAIDIYLTTVFVVFTCVRVALVLFSNASFNVVRLFADNPVWKPWADTEVTEVTPFFTYLTFWLVFW